MKIVRLGQKILVTKGTFHFSGFPVEILVANLIFNLEVSFFLICMKVIVNLVSDC